ncbi:MAG: hypothetical protein JWM47_4116 [Acidimicrobiales bacterium]|nr:hypothetical protein [Acidimicrobiales bacterium]
MVAWITVGYFLYAIEIRPVIPDWRMRLILTIAP